MEYKPLNRLTTRRAGEAAEAMACRYLEQQGLRLIRHNYRCRAGEVDLIMQDGEQLVFVEVRSRRNSRYGTPAESITKTKQKRLYKAAAHYLLSSRSNAPCRFDVIAIVQQDNRLEWIKDAFQVV
jgi:putative endonuclease